VLLELAVSVRAWLIDRQGFDCDASTSIVRLKRANRVSSWIAAGLRHDAASISSPIADENWPLGRTG
jgi:hypothetical protein